MNNRVVYNQILKVVLMSVFTEYILRKYKLVEEDLQKNLLEERAPLFDFVKKGQYGRLDIRVDWPSSVDKISIENTECNTFDKDIICFVHFDFKSTTPMLSYTYKDSTIKLSLPDKFELEG